MLQQAWWDLCAVLSLKHYSAATFPAPPGLLVPHPLQALRALGLLSYDYYLTDGHFHYVGPANVRLTTVPTESLREIASPGPYCYLWAEQAITCYQLGQTDHATFCRQLAAAGIEKWTVDVCRLTRIYYDVTGTVQAVEEIQLPTGHSLPCACRNTHSRNASVER